MHPEIAKTLVAHHRDELAQDAAACRRAGRRRFPRWHVSWTRAVLAPAVAPGMAGANRAGQAWPARFVAGDHHFGPPLGLTPPRAGQPVVLSLTGSRTVTAAGAAAQPASSRSEAASSRSEAARSPDRMAGSPPGSADRSR